MLSSVASDQVSMPPFGLPRISQIRDRFAGRGRSAGHLSRLSMAALDGRIGRALIGIVLALHLVGGAGAGHAAPSADDVASLSAALGQPVPTCHQGDSDHPGAPAQPDGCDHCICCQTVSGNIALGADRLDARSAARLPQRVAYPTRENAIVRSSRAGRTAARGPPALS